MALQRTGDKQLSEQMMAFGDIYASLDLIPPEVLCLVWDNHTIVHIPHVCVTKSMVIIETRLAQCRRYNLERIWMKGHKNPLLK